MGSRPGIRLKPPASHSLGMITAGEQITPVRNPSRSDSSMHSSGESSELECAANLSKSVLIRSSLSFAHHERTESISFNSYAYADSREPPQRCRKRVSGRAKKVLALRQAIFSAMARGNRDSHRRCESMISSYSTQAKLM